MDVPYPASNHISRPVQYPWQGVKKLVACGRPLEYRLCALSFTICLHNASTCHKQYSVIYDGIEFSLSLSIYIYIYIYIYIISTLD